jgi:1,4-dihydroxy-2-naphthoate octaprenyltransferase
MTTESSLLLATSGTSTSQAERGRGAAIRSIKVLLFSASIVPSVLAGAVAFRMGAFRWLDFSLLLLAVFLGQAGGDYLYYYFTHQHTDARDAHTKIFAGWRPFLAETMLRGRAVLMTGFACLAVDAALGIYFTVKSGPLVLALAACGGAIAIFFTPLMLRGYKAPVIFVAFGPLTVMGIVFVLSGRFPLEAALASLPVAFWVTVVAHLKGAHFQFVDGPSGEVSLKLGTRSVLVLTALAYLSLAAGVALGRLPAWSLLGLASLPLAWTVIRVVARPTSPLPEYVWAVVRAILVLVLGGLGMVAGYLTPLLF